MSIYKEKYSDPLKQVNFYCRFCRNSYECEPDRIEDVPEQAHHPYDYYAECPNCGRENQQVAWERNLLKAYTSGNMGPKTPEGIAKVTQNVAGHPTPEETQRTKFNALKHGLYSRVATYFPAKPGKYPHCQGCDVDQDFCAKQPACIKRTELYMKHHIAFETKDPGMLTYLRSDLHANIQAIIDDMIYAIVSEGVSVHKPDWYVDKDGRLQIARYHDGENDKVISQIYAHPLLKPLIDLLQKNNLSLADMEMTPKVQEEHDLIRGHLEESRGTSALEYQQQQNEILDRLEGYIQRSQERKNTDPILIEYKQEETQQELIEGQ